MMMAKKPYLPDIRPVDHELWPKFVFFVEMAPGIARDVTTPKGFRDNGYILWHAFLAGAATILRSCRVIKA